MASSSIQPSIKMINLIIVRIGEDVCLAAFSLGSIFFFFGCLLTVAGGEFRAHGYEKCDQSEAANWKILAFAGILYMFTSNLTPSPTLETV